MRCIGLDQDECYGFAGDSGLCGDCKNERGLKLLREISCYAPPDVKRVSKGNKRLLHANVPLDLLRKVEKHIAMIESDKKAQEKVNESAKSHKKQQDDDLAAGRAARLAGVGVSDAPVANRDLQRHRILPSVGGTMLGEPAKGNDR